MIRLWEATDRDSAIHAHRNDIRAIATRRESGASSELMHELPKLEIVVCYGVGRDAIDPAYAKARGVRRRTPRTYLRRTFIDPQFIDPQFKCLDNAALQPHHASDTTETWRAMGKLVRDNLNAHFSGVTLITPVI
jgi:lactate dehydrogenase-like 2-hydroxyacid dehydrogenase